MKISRILEQKGTAVETIRPDQKVREAVARMSLRRIGALVGSSDGVTCVGIIADRDVVRALAKHGADALDMTVNQVMTKPAPECSADDSIAHVMAEMTRTRNRHYTVLDHGRLVGLVSIGDLVKDRIDEVTLESDVLRTAYLASH